MSIESSKHLQNSSLLSSESSRLSSQSPLLQKGNNQSVMSFSKMQSGTLGPAVFNSQADINMKQNSDAVIVSSLSKSPRSSLRTKKSLPETDLNNYNEKVKIIKSKLPPPPLDPPPAIPPLKQMFSNSTSNDINKHMSQTPSVAALTSRTVSNVLVKSSKTPPITNIPPPILSKPVQNHNPSVTNTVLLTKTPNYNATPAAVTKTSNHSNIPPPLQNTTSTSPGSNKMSIRQDSGISSDSFSQTSSPSYTSKTMETPLLPYNISTNTQSKVVQGKVGIGANRQKSISKKSSETFDLDKDAKNGSVLTKSVSTPASLQTIVRFHNGSNMSLHHKVNFFKPHLILSVTKLLLLLQIIRDIRRPSKHYVGHIRLRFRLAQVLVNAIALLAIGGGLAAYFKGTPASIFRRIL